MDRDQKLIGVNRLRPTIYICTLDLVRLLLYMACLFSPCLLIRFF